MQYVNDDMDDLFRKAGEEYPLHGGKPDWDKVAAALQQETPSQPHDSGKKPLWWLLLLLPLAFVCNHFRDGVGNGPSAHERMPTKQYPKQQSTGKQGSSPTVQRLGAESAIPEQNTPVPQQQLRKTAQADLPHSNDFVAIQSEKMFVPSAKKQRFIVPPADGGTLGENAIEEGVFAGNPAAAAAGTSNEEAEDSGWMGRHAPQQIERTEAVRTELSGELSASPLFATMHRQLATDSGQRPILPTAVQVRSPYWYAGVVGSADLTSVQLQRTSKAGWQAGLLGGYQFSRRWSVETGFYLTRKYYYTEGDYFHKGHTYIPPNTSITEVNGYCTMVEVPINIRYNLAQRGHHTWFATAGLSSYFMKKEGYDFLYYYHNTGTSHVHSKTYRNSSQNLFSVVQVSGGYSRPFGQNLSLRVEPYLKLPLTGLGYGRLHFSSAGLSLGLTKRF